MLCKAKRKLREEELVNKEQKPLFSRLSKVENRDLAFTTLSQIKPFNFEVFAPDVMLVLKNLNAELDTMKQEKIELEQARLQVSNMTSQKADNSSLEVNLNAAKNRLKELNKTFNKTIKSCLQAAKDACGAVYKDIEVASLIGNLTKRLQEMSHLREIECTTCYEKDDIGHQWVNHTWSLLGSP